MKTPVEVAYEYEAVRKVMVDHIICMQNTLRELKIEEPFEYKIYRPLPAALCEHPGDKELLRLRWENARITNSLGCDEREWAICTDVYTDDRLLDCKLEDMAKLYPYLEEFQDALIAHIQFVTAKAITILGEKCQTKPS